jgi:DNA adenine methylase
MYYSPLRYPGGKTQFYFTVANILETNNLTGCVYVEPFAGGAGVALKLLLEGKVNRVILNDNDNNIYSFWYSILNYTNRFIKKIQDTDITVEEWRKQKKIIATSNSVFKKGFATFFLNRTNRSGILSSNPIGGLEQKGNFKIDCRFNKNRLIDRIKRIANKKDKIEISNLDAKEFIKEFKIFETSFWFIDPPYYHKGKQLYLNYFTHSDHVALNKIIFSHLRNSYWILTYDICDQIQKIYMDANKSIITLRYSAAVKRKAGEYMFYRNLVIDNV